MNILMPIETSSRELMYKTYLCHLLADRGFNCFLGSKSQINHLLVCMTNYIYLDKGYHLGESEKLYTIIKNNKGIIVNLDEEGGVDFADHSTLLSRYSKVFFSMADLTFLWGTKQLEIIKNNLHRDSKVVISGHPRFEMLKNEYNFFYEEEVKKIKRQHGSFVLINTNMGFGNNIKGDDFVVSNYHERFNKIDQIISFDKKKVTLFIEVAKKLSEKTNFNVVFRPHPEEDLHIYNKAFEGIDNISVINTGSVIPWLISAKRMIHPDCTTAIESIFIGKQPLSILPDNHYDELVTILPISVSKNFTNIDKLIAAVNDKSELIVPENYELLNSYFSIERKSFFTIVEELSNLKDLYFKNFLQLSMREKIWLKIKCYKSDFFHKKGQKLMKTKLYGFNWSNINKFHNLILKSEHYVNDVTFKKVTSQLFEFYKK